MPGSQKTNDGNYRREKQQIRGTTKSPHWSEKIHPETECRKTEIDSLFDHYGQHKSNVFF